MISGDINNKDSVRNLLPLGSGYFGFLIKIRKMVRGMKSDKCWDNDMQSAEILGMLDKKMEKETKNRKRDFESSTTLKRVPVINKLPETICPLGKTKPDFMEKERCDKIQKIYKEITQTD